MVCLQFLNSNLLFSGKLTSFSTRTSQRVTQKRKKVVDNQSCQEVATKNPKVVFDFKL